MDKKSIAILGTVVVVAALIFFINPYNFRGAIAQMAIVCEEYCYEECGQWDTSAIKECNKPDASKYPAGIWEKGTVIPSTSLAFKIYRACPADKKVAVFKDLLGPAGECARLESKTGDFCVGAAGAADTWYFKGVDTSELAAGQWSVARGYYPYEQFNKVGCGQQSNAYTSPTLWGFYVYTCTERTEKTCLSWERKCSATKPDASESVKSVRCTREFESCGNGVCDYDETPQSCPRDCGGIVSADCENPAARDGEFQYFTCADGTKVASAQCIDGRWDAILVDCPGTGETPGPVDETDNAGSGADVGACKDVAIDDGDPCTRDTCTVKDGGVVVSHQAMEGCIPPNYAAVVTVVAIFAIFGLLVQQDIIKFGKK